MNILQVVPSMDPKGGGVCQGIRNNIPEYTKQGIQNEVVCFDDPKADFIKTDLFITHALGKAKTPWNYNKNFIPWILSNIERFDVIIVHGLWLYQSQAAIKAMLTYRKTNGSKPKVYVMSHGMLDPYFQKAKDRKLKALRNTIYWKLLENKVINQADGILFTCEEELLLARTAFPNYKPKKEINVGYGIQPPPVFHEDMKIAFASTVPQWNGKPFILFLSRIHPKKGVDMLITAYLKLEQELNDLPQLIIAGPNDHSYAKEMLNMSKPSKNILFAGMLNGDAKWGAFYESEVFVLPSHQENFGIAVVEAMACKTPVLISNKVNIWREIKNGEAGFVAEDKLDDTLSLLKRWLILPEIDKKLMAENTFKTYQQKFSVEKIALEFINTLFKQN
tara:strand:+ start:11794 stop:12966 length:1173 start_codon:yes stop_codon:yes gene_type:complete